MTTTSGHPEATSTKKIPLSLNQEFVLLFDQGDDDGPFGPHYHIVEAWRVTGAVDAAALRIALRDVVDRHEALRTVIVRGEDDKYQKIYPPAMPELIVRTLAAAAGTSREEQAEALIRDPEHATISAEQPPFIRAVLARFDEQDSVLAIQTHHIATDAWSVRVIIRDLVNRYAVHCGRSVPVLPEAPQYREFALWQRESPDAQPAAALDYWRKTLDGALISAIHTDFARSAGIPQSPGAHQLSIPAEVVTAAAPLGRSNRSTTVNVPLASYHIA